MKIYAEIYRNDERVSDCDYNCELKVEYSYSPSSLWLVGLRKKELEGRRPNPNVLYRKILKVFYGKVQYKGRDFDVELALLLEGGAVCQFLLNYGHARIHADGEKFELRINYEICGEYIDDHFVFDYDEVKTIPEYQGLSFVDCVKKLVNDDYDKRMSFDVDLDKFKDL